MARESETSFFTHIYVGYANSVIAKHTDGDQQIHKISRAKIELEILAEIDQANFPLIYRLAFIDTILNTDTFDIYWVGQRYNYGLEKKAVARLQADRSLLDEVKSPYPIDAPETDSDESSLEEPSSPNNLLRSSESPPPSPLPPEILDNALATHDHNDSSSDDEPLMARARPEATKQPVIPSNPAMPWKDPSTNPLARLPQHPHGINRPAPIPISEARSGKTVANTRSRPSHDLDFDSDSVHESDADADGDSDTGAIPIDPLLTGKPYRAPKPKSPRKPAPKPAMKTKKGSEAEGTKTSKRKRNVHFDLPADEEEAGIEDAVASEYPTPSPVKKPPPKKRRVAGKSVESAPAAPTETDGAPATRGGSKARGRGRGRGSRGGGGRGKARGGSGSETRTGSYGGKSV